MSISLRQEVRVGADAEAPDIVQSINTASAVNEMRRQVERLVTTALLDLAGAIGARRIVLLLDTASGCTSQAARRWVSGCATCCPACVAPSTAACA